jgi:hypothetical protein
MTGRVVVLYYRGDSTIEKDAQALDLAPAAARKRSTTSRVARSTTRRRSHRR